MKKKMRYAVLYLLITFDLFEIISASFHGTKPAFRYFVLQGK